MQVTGSATVAAPLARVWDALQDPAVLARTIPGCQSLEETGPDAYRMTVSAGVASITGTYVGSVELTDPDPPHAFTLRARGQGAPGTVDATVRVRLSDGDGATRVDYDADAVVGGMIGGVGQRVLGSVARRTAGQFFAAVERDLTVTPITPDANEPPASENGAGVEPPAHLTRPLAAPPPAPGGFMGRIVPASHRDPATWQMAAFLAGGAVALAGVAIGHALSRRPHR
ncbi:SRPBCC family protein [Actinomadura fibrosa]|uniref:Carbon monoxide dehydrogenase subunit G n=1 Tax=Actinomadura fibrosa TaxID=111802 RepID=A0ABW2XMW2_9ACTN|nr:carbon monoxide dehydrogenase subunit G [Actinomadura fibrosa]